MIWEGTENPINRVGVTNLIVFMKKEFKAIKLREMSSVLGGGNITHETTILFSRKTRQAAVQEDEATEITGTVTIDKEK